MDLLVFFLSYFRFRFVSLNFNTCDSRESGLWEPSSVCTTIYVGWTDSRRINNCMSLILIALPCLEFLFPVHFVWIVCVANGKWLCVVFFFAFAFTTTWATRNSIQQLKQLFEWLMHTTHQPTAIQCKQMRFIIFHLVSLFIYGE